MTVLELSAGDTAWVLTSAALVLLMTPGLAFFYGGMVRANSVLNMLMMNFICMAIVGVLWVTYGYGLTFGSSVGGAGIIGNPSGYIFMSGMVGATPTGAIPEFAFAAFQSAFAIITVALISGAVADRMSFSAWMAFAALWATLVYFPAAHWVFAFTSADGTVVGGWIANQLKAIDYAGGTAIHINAGMAALVLAIALKPRIGFGQRPMRPHNMTLVMLGAGLLWFGWFGFNAGSALSAGTAAAHVWVTTLAATAAAILSWIAVEKIRDGHFTSLGAASGTVAGLVAITPAGGAVTPFGALCIGAIAGAVCAMAVTVKYRFGYDDSLDVVGVHLVGGIIGTLLIGLFASSSAPNGVSGLFYGGGLDQLWRQAVGAVSVLAYSAVMTFIIITFLKSIMKIRVAPKTELDGIDLHEHAEVGYDLSNIRYTSYRGISHRLVVPAKEEVKA